MIALLEPLESRIAPAGLITATLDRGALTLAAMGGTDTLGDHFGFVAMHIGSFRSLNLSALLTAAPMQVIALSPTTGDVAIREP